MKKLTGLLMFCLTITMVSAQGDFEQDKSKLTPRTAVQIADRYYGEGQYFAAAELYRQALEKKQDDRYATFWLAMSLNFARDYKGAAEAFEIFYELASAARKEKDWKNEVRREYDEGRLYYGIVLQRLGRYDEAKKQFARFRSEYNNDDPAERARVIAWTKRLSTACDSVQLLGKAKVKVKPLPAGINHAYSETGPFGIGDKELYYTSTGKDGVHKYIGNTNELYTNIYKVRKEGNGWGKPQKLEIVNEKDDFQKTYFNCAGKFNKAKTRFYFSRCVERENDIPLCNIFVSNVKNGSFSAPERLPDNVNDKDIYTSWQPAVRATKNKDIEYIYFSSNRPGGKGGYDIWYTQRTAEGQFTEPALAQGFTNTVGDEVTPYWDDSTQTLYFSSNGHLGFGGYDVFKTQQYTDGKAKKWTPVKNLGTPLNSGADDLFYTIAPDLSWGYLSSNREGSLPLDGVTTASDDIFMWENFKYGVEGTVKQTGTDELVTTNTPGKYNLYEKKADGTRQLVAVDSTSTSGTYFFKLNPDTDYEVEIDKPGFMVITESITTKGLEGEDTLQQQTKVNKDAYLVYGELREAENPDVKIIGPANILVYEVVGKDKETLFMESKISDKSYTYSVKIPADKNYKILVRREGYFAGYATATTKNLSPGADSIRADITLKKLELNKEYKLQNILYEFGKATLSKSSEVVLDTLYKIMVDNPSFVVELSAHTDGVGSDAGNMRLSQARAQSCVDYLIARGIHTKRLVPVGYGKTRPIAPNKNADGSDNPEGRALNRRTEFKILKM